jgi:hypothetical protein
MLFHYELKDRRAQNSLILRANDDLRFGPTFLACGILRANVTSRNLAQNSLILRVERLSEIWPKIP